jgi:hypothetical protein
MDDTQKEYPFWTEHDVLGFLVDEQKISQDDLNKLEQLGVFYSSEYDSLIMYT